MFTKNKRSRLSGAVLLSLAVAALLVLNNAAHGLGHHVVRAVIVTGEDSYSGHHWQETSVELKTILEADKKFQVSIEADPNFLATGDLSKVDVLIIDFRNGKPLAKDDQAQAALVKFLHNGKGMVTVHWGNGAFPYWPEYNNMVGRSQILHHDKRGPFTVKIVDHDSPITKGMADFQTDDELYYDNKEGSVPIHTLATAHSNVKEADFPMASTVQYGKGRVFNTPLGHDVKALQVPEVGELIRRGTAWAAGSLK